VLFCEGERFYLDVKTGVETDLDGEKGGLF